MGLMDFFRLRKPRAATPSKDDVADRIVNADPASGYRPQTPISFFTGQGNQLPPLHLFYQELEAMRVHPDVSIALNYYKSGIVGAEFDIKARSPRIEEYIREQLRRLWAGSLVRVQEAYDWGWVGGQIMYRRNDDGSLAFDAIKTYHARDTLVLRRGSQYMGVRVHNAGGNNGSVDLWGPAVGLAKGFWYAHNAEHGAFFGRSQLLGAWRPWRRLAWQDGGEDVIDIAVYRFGVRGVVCGYPPDMPTADAAKRDPRNPSNQDKARFIAESYKSGASVSMPTTQYQNGSPHWTLDVPGGAEQLNVDSLINYTGSLEKKISMGIGVPPELLQASETGSGYSGREIPLESFYEGQMSVARSIVMAAVEQIVRPLVCWNFGPEYGEFDVEVLPLLQSRAKRLGKSQEGDGRERGPDGKFAPAGGSPGLLLAGRWKESDHPRGDDGRWITKDEIDAAKKDPRKAAALRARVTDPKSRALLDHRLQRDLFDDVPAEGEPAEAKNEYQKWLETPEGEAAAEAFTDSARRPGHELRARKLDPANVFKNRGRPGVEFGKPADGRKPVASGPTDEEEEAADGSIFPKAGRLAYQAAREAGADHDTAMEAGYAASIKRDDVKQVGYATIHGVKPGDVFEVMDNRGQGKHQVKFFPGREEGEIGVGEANDKTPRTYMPEESASHFVHDLNGVVKVPGRSGNKLVDAVASGDGEYLGKGNDGMAFAVGDKVVKVSTTVPYHPFNPGNRSPGDAAAHLANEAENTARLLDNKVPGILPAEFIRHGDKGFLIRDRVEPAESLTAEQLRKVRRSMDAMHAAGFVLGDEVQVGLKDGEPFIYDLGAVRRSTRPADLESDSDRFGHFAKKMGHESLVLAAHGRAMMASMEDSRELLGDEETDAEIAEYARGVAESEAAAGGPTAEPEAEADDDGARPAPKYAPASDSPADVDAAVLRYMRENDGAANVYDVRSATGVASHGYGDDGHPLEKPLNASLKRLHDSGHLEAVDGRGNRFRLTEKGKAADKPADGGEAVDGPPPDAQTGEEVGKPDRVAGKPVLWVRAKAGGEVSTVNGQHYKGGQLMPIHGLSPKVDKAATKKKGPGDGQIVAPKDGENEGKGGRFRTPWTPEQIAAERKRREEQADYDRKADDIRSGVLGAISMGLGDRDIDGHGGTKGVSNLKQWKEWAENLGNEKLDKIVSELTDTWNSMIDGELAEEQASGKTSAPPDAIEWDRNRPAEAAADDAQLFGRSVSKHLRQFPKSLLARELAQHIVHKGRGVDDWHKLEMRLRAIADDVPDLAPLPGETAAGLLPHDSTVPLTASEALGMRRAIKGGEHGNDGQWYEGGRFLPDHGAFSGKGKRKKLAPLPDNSRYWDELRIEPGYGGRGYVVKARLHDDYFRNGGTGGEWQSVAPKLLFDSPEEAHDYATRAIAEREKKAGLEWGVASPASITLRAGSEKEGKPFAPAATTAAAPAAPAKPVNVGAHGSAYKRALELMRTPGKALHGAFMRGDVVNAAAAWWGVSKAEASRRLELHAAGKPVTDQPETTMLAGRPFGGVRVKFEESKHPRDDHGRWIEANMTLGEYDTHLQRTGLRGNYGPGPQGVRLAHRTHVEDSLMAGAGVPPEVLAEYPDLAKRYSHVKPATHRVQVARSKRMRRDQIIAEAEEDGATSSDLHGAAAEIRQLDAEAVDVHNRIIERAKTLLDKYTDVHRKMNQRAKRGGANQIEDVTHIPGIDEVSRQMAGEFPGHFGNSYGYDSGSDYQADDSDEILFGYLTEGKRKPLTDEEVYEKAAARVAETLREKRLAGGEQPEADDDGPRPNWDQNKPLEPHEMTLAEYSRARGRHLLNRHLTYYKNGFIGLPEPDKESSRQNRVKLAAEAGIDGRNPRYVEAVTSWGLHKLHVAAALGRGESVPTRILKAYPDLIPAGMTLSTVSAPPPVSPGLAGVIKELARDRVRLVSDLVNVFTKTEPLGWLSSTSDLLSDYLDSFAQAVAFSRLSASLAAIRRVASALPARLPADVGTASLAGLLPDVWVTPETIAGDPEARPIANLVSIQNAVSDLAARNVLTRPEFDQLAAEARAEAFTVAGIVEKGVIGTIRDLTADAVDLGENQAEWRAKVFEELNGSPFLSPAHAETVFRANVYSAYSRGLEQVLADPMVDDLFPFAAIDPILDNRCRPWHAALAKAGIDGTNVFYRDDPTFITCRPPSDYGCRCGWRPLTVAQAAAAGVAEAIRWLETGIPPVTRTWCRLPENWQQSPGWVSAV